MCVTKYQTSLTLSVRQEEGLCPNRSPSPLSVECVRGGAGSGCAGMKKIRRGFFRLFVSKKSMAKKKKKSRARKPPLEDGRIVTFEAPLTGQIIEGVAIETTHRCDFNNGCGPRCTSHGRPRRMCVVVVTTPLPGYIFGHSCLYPMRASYNGLKLIERTRLKPRSTSVSHDVLLRYKARVFASLMPPHWT